MSDNVTDVQDSVELDLETEVEGDSIIDDIFSDEPESSEDGTSQTPEVSKTSAPSKPKGKPGRPRVYTPEQRAGMASLIREHGMSGAQRVLRASDNAKPEDFSGRDDLEREANYQRALRWAKDRDQALWPSDKAFNVSIPTLKSIADEAGIKLTVGRPKMG